jgi:hypothetical protein
MKPSSPRRRTNSAVGCLGNMTRKENNARRMREWRAKNPERNRAIAQACYWRNPEKWRANRRRYPSKRTAQSREQYRKWAGKKRASDPSFKLLSNLRYRLWFVLKGKAKATSTVSLLGCSMANFKIYLESLFEPGMSWANYGNKEGQWSVDHIMPCAIFDFSKPEHQKRCFHFSNLRPLWHVENLRKHAKQLTIK